MTLSPVDVETNYDGTVEPSSQNPESPRVEIYTDGACLKNPGPGGYGAVIIEGDRVREVSQGFRHTTNNRMELMAVTESLKLLDGMTPAVIYSDSQYVVNAINKGWIHKWKFSSGSKKNWDLWKELLGLLEIHNVEIAWVKGHAGIPGNEKADDLATRAARLGPLSVDEEYESLPQELPLFSLS